MAKREKWARTGKDRPLYREVYTVLKGRILSGDYAPGARIETEEELRTQFGASRVTVRQGLALLVAERLIERRHGHGTFVPESVRRRLRVLCVCGLDFAASHQHHLGPYYSDVIVMAQAEAARLGWEMETVWLPTYRAGERSAAYCEEETLRQYVGILFAGCGSVHPVLKRVQALTLRHAMLSPRHKLINSVWLDYPQGILLALDQFDDRRRPVLIMGGGDLRETVEAELARARRKGVLVDLPADTELGSVTAAAYHRTLELMAAGQDLSRLIILDDVVALGVTRALLVGGYRNRPLKLVILAGRQEIEPLGLPATFVVHDTEAEVRQLFTILRDQLRNPKAAAAPWTSGYRLMA
jgi:hypothetical protein